MSGFCLCLSFYYEEKKMLRGEMWINGRDIQRVQMCPFTEVTTMAPKGNKYGDGVRPWEVGLVL